MRSSTDEVSICLQIASDKQASGLAFPLVSSGVYGWPRRDAIAAAVDTIAGADTRVEDVRIVAFDVAMYDEVREQLSGGQ